MSAARTLRRRTRDPAHSPAAAPPRRCAAPDFAPPLASLASVPAAYVRGPRAAVPIQARLEIGPVGDRHEREADALADRVTRMSGPAPAPVPITPVARPGAAVQRKAESAAAAGGGDLSGALAAQGRGEALPADARAFFEPRFGRDLGHVRVHDDAKAGALARGINAHAFTAGSDVYFADGRYDPGSDAGRHLLAHEIVHTFQQAGGGPAPVQRAVVKVGALKVEVNYGSVINVSAADLPGRVIAAITAYTGTAPDAAQDATVRGYGPATQNWLLFALKLLADNTAGAAFLNATDAVARLVARAPVSVNPPLPDDDDRFVHEVLEFSGWKERALGDRLAPPGATDRTAINKIVNPPSSATGTGVDKTQFERRLRPALEHFITVLDPGRWTSVGTRPLARFQTLGDIIQAEARSFFAPYADAAIGNIHSLSPGWKASANIFSTGTMVVDKDKRVGHLLNRADVVGGATKSSLLIPDPNIYADTNFDARVPGDLAERLRIAEEIEKDPKFQPILDRLVQHTGRKSGSGASTKIGLVTEYNAAGQSACEAHWSGIDTLCHEVLHALVHPNFNAAAARHKFPQVVREGFTEVLGNQLFNKHIVKKAKDDVRFQALMETGVTGAPCSKITPGTVGYEEAGKGAKAILDTVKDDNFRAAYFMGRTDLAGLP